MRLADWHDSFMDALRPHGHDGALLNLVNARESGRLGIYKNNAYQALLACLQGNFPICEAILGETCFELLARRYVSEVPMSSANLNEYGASFPEFLQQEMSTHTAFTEFDYLPELAVLEWRLLQCYYAADTLAVSPLSALAELGEQQQQNVILVLRPDIVLFQSKYPLYEIWCRHQVQEQAIDIVRPQSEYYFCIYRHPFKARVERISPEEHQLLVSISAGASLSELNHGSCDMALLAKFISQSWVCGFKLQRDEP